MISDPERREKAIVNGNVPIYWQKQSYEGEPAKTIDIPSHDADADAAFE